VPLTPSELAKFRMKRYICPYWPVESLQLHNSPVNCSIKLFKPSKDLDSFLVWNEKKFFRLCVFLEKRLPTC